MEGVSSRRRFLQGAGVLGACLVLNPSKALADFSLQVETLPTDRELVFIADPSNIGEVFQSIEKLTSRHSVRIVLESGEYQFGTPSNTSIPALNGTRTNSDITKVDRKVGNLKKLTIESKDSDNKAVVNIEGEVGLYLPNIEDVTINNVHFKGGKLPPKPATPRRFDTLRSLVLLEDAKNVSVNGCIFEGIALPEGQEPDGTASIRGFSLISDLEMSRVEVSGCNFINNSWDSVLFVGDGNINAKVKDSKFSRSAGVYSSFYLSDGTQRVEAFSGRVGCGIAGLRNTFLSVENCSFFGYKKVFGVSDTRDTRIKDVYISAPEDWNLPEAYSAMWICCALPSSKIRFFSKKPNLTIERLKMYENLSISDDEVRKIPFYLRWFEPLGLLGNVTINNVNLAVAEMSIPIGREDSGWKCTVDDHIVTKTVLRNTSAVAISNWRLMIVKRVEEGGRYDVFGSTSFSDPNIVATEAEVVRRTIPKFP